MSRLLFENKPNEICCHLSENASKASFFGPISSKITLTKERKGEKEEAARRKKGGEGKQKKNQ